MGTRTKQQGMKWCYPGWTQRTNEPPPKFDKPPKILVVRRRKRVRRPRKRIRRYRRSTS